MARRYDEEPEVTPTYGWDQPADQQRKMDAEMRQKLREIRIKLLNMVFNSSDGGANLYEVLALIRDLTVEEKEDGR